MVDVLRFFLVVAFMFTALWGFVQAQKAIQEPTTWHGYQMPTKETYHNTKGVFDI